MTLGPSICLITDRHAIDGNNPPLFYRLGHSKLPQEAQLKASVASSHIHFTLIPQADSKNLFKEVRISMKPTLTILTSFYYSCKFAG